MTSGSKNKLVPKKRAEKRTKNDDIVDALNGKKCFASKQRKPRKCQKSHFGNQKEMNENCPKKTNETVQLTNKIVKYIEVGDRW